MAEPRIAPYGSWQSPITSDLISSASIRLGGIALDGADVTWLEMRPAEGGRYVIVRQPPNGQATDVTPRPFSAQTRVHEYGGGAYLVDRGTVYFSNMADQRLYRQDRGAEPRPITPEAKLRYADGVMDHRRRRIICVREDHTNAGQEAINTIVSIDVEGEDPSPGGRTLISGHDFYASPRLSPDGRQMVWLAWNHPNMPWDGTELWVGEFQADGTITGARRVAGGANESIFQPEWSPDGVLYFVLDHTGWWNLYRWRDGAVEGLLDMEAEFGRPQWLFGWSTYGFVSPEQIICSYTQAGRWHLASLDTETRQLTSLAPQYTDIADVCVGDVRVAPGRVLFIGGSPTQSPSVVHLDLTTGDIQVLRQSQERTLDAGYLTAPEAVEFPTEQGKTAHALYYAPRNADYAAPPGERPPLLVFSHGGPTGATSSVLSLGIQFWTSRGIAVLDVNYGGSTGYGRPYRQRLDGQWGVVDVDDCVNGARYLVRRGDVDGERLMIHGGSAGGYTTLCALTFRDAFKAGASYYGVSDLEALAKETHKFESRYLDRMIGPYPERRDLYFERSPIHFTDRLSCPVVFFQGLEDRVVPPNQAELMVEVLREKGLPVAYVPFEGERHGFRQAANIKRALDSELYFYSRVFGFEPADPLEPVEIENLA